jgi:cbb3-type cytochrome oxidase maturation protein
MYFPYFITYILAGFAISLIAFLWALKNGQFQEQQRARFLPLEAEMPLSPGSVSHWKRIEIYALFFLAGAGLLSSAAVLVVALVSAR